MRNLAYLFLAAGLVVGCTDPTDLEPTEPNQLRGDDKSDDAGPLWGGLTSITLERYTSDPCNNGRTALGDEPVGYGEWERTRAAIRNICFEVWKPGVTDWDNPDFWKQLDVRAYYRYGDAGDFQWEHVSSIDRRGNNRRYAWSLDFDLDPTVYVPSVPAMKVPFTIVSESNGWALVKADLQVYFTVNGRVLNSPSNRPFVVRYTNYLRMPSLAPNPNGYVLHDIVTCAQGAARFGSGAGFFAADIRDANAIAALGAGNGSLIYGVPVAGSAQLVSMTYGTQISVSGQTLPGFIDAGGLRIVPEGSSMKVELDVYDRALGATRQLTSTFAGCSAATN